VIVFSHDIASTRELYTTLITTLVDRGFVVVTINHPYLASATTFYDGTTAIGRDPLTKPSAEAAEPQWEDYFVQLHEFLSDEADVWSADIRCVIDELARRDADSGGTFYHRLDVERVGVMGHGFGAAAAANAALDDERVAAWVNLDGRLYGRAEHAPPTQPAMLIAPSDVIDEDPSRSTLWTECPTWIARTDLADIGRFSFTDLGVLQQRFNCPVDADAFGAADPAWAIRMTGELVTAFFRQTLADEPTALLNDTQGTPTTPWPGVTVAVREGQPASPPTASRAVAPSATQPTPASQSATTE
jgi:pimeloyl-ACP methyl ester carboxylesterase